MIPISKAVEEIIVATPYLEEGLAKGIINLSSLSRLIKPQIQKRLYKKDVSVAALVMALKRYQPKLKRKVAIPKLFSQMQDITIRSNLVELTLRNSLELDQIRREILKTIASEKNNFFNIIQGVKESTLVISKNLEPIVRKHLSGKAVSRVDNLSSITINLPPENRNTPGVYYTLLKTLAWNDINLVEVISNYNEVSLIFDNAVIDKAFSLIKSLTV